VGRPCQRRGVRGRAPHRGLIPIPCNFDFLADGTVFGGMDRKFQLRDRYIVEIGGDHEKRVDRRLVIALAIGLDSLQNR
jgi:uncharacterized protein YxjI